MNTVETLFTDYEMKISNHPVHIIDGNERFSPSAFIPFCQFGRNYSLTSVFTENFSVPVCQGFKPKIVLDQLCYEINVNNLTSNISEEDIKMGLVLYLDYNRERNDGEIVKEDVKETINNKLFIDNQIDMETVKIYIESSGLHKKRNTN